MTRRMILIQVAVTVVLLAVSVPFLLRDNDGRDRRETHRPAFDPAVPTTTGPHQEVVASVGLLDVAFSPDSRRVAGLSDGAAWSWRLSEDPARKSGFAQEGESLQSCGGASLAYAPGPKRAVGCVDGRVLAGGPPKEANSGSDGPLAELGGAHPQQVTELAFSRDGRLLASTSIDGYLIVWDLATRLPVGDMVLIWKIATATRSALGITGVAFLADNRTVAVASADQVTLYDIRARAVSAVVPAGGRALSVAISPDGRTMAIGRDNGSVLLWSLEGRTAVGSPLLGLDSYVYRVAFGAKGDFLVGGSQRATVIWNPATGEQLRPAFPGGSGFALSPDGTTLALFDHNNPVIRLYRTGFRTAG
jgi:WD40 repeat protein